MKTTIIYQGDAKKMLAKLQGSKKDVEQVKAELMPTNFKAFLPTNYRQATSTSELLFKDDTTGEALPESELIKRYNKAECFFIIPASLFVKEKRNEG